MATGVGLRIGRSESVAVIVDSEAESEPNVIVRDSVLHMTEGGDTILGGDAPEGHVRTVTDFVAAVGNPEGISVDGEAYRAEDLLATAMFCLINLAAENLTPPTEISAGYPADWSAETLDALRDSLDYLGLRSLTLVADSDATERSDTDNARRAALAALASAEASAAAAAGTLTVDQLQQLPTEEFPAAFAALSTSPIVDAQAYSAASPVYANAMAVTEETTKVPPATIPPAAPSSLRPRRTPLVLAAAAAAVLALGGGGAAVVLQSNTSTDVPEFQDAQSAPQRTTTAPAVPIAFPTVTATPAPAPAVEQPQPVVVSTTTVVVAPPPPPVELPPPPPPVVVPPIATPPTTQPTTVPTTTTPETTETDTTTPTDNGAGGEVIKHIPRGGVHVETPP